MGHNGDGTIDDIENTAFVPGILAMADCFEPDSANQKLIDLAVNGAAALGTDVTILDLRDLELPAYAGRNRPNGLPQGAHAFRQLLWAHDGFLIALPSGHEACPPLLMNAIAWSVCPAFGADAGAAYAGKCASLMSATGESEILGQHLARVRNTLSRLGVLVLPDALILPGDAAFAEAGGLANADTGRKLEQQLDRFIGTIRWAQSRARV